MIFVGSRLPDIANKAGPNPGVLLRLEWVGFRVPAIEISDDGDASSIGRPNSEVGSGAVVLLEQMCPELLINPKMAPLAEQMQIIRTEKLLLRLRLSVHNASTQF